MKVHLQHPAQGKSMVFDDPTKLPSMDIDSPAGGVSVAISVDGRRLWVNVDGVSVMRISNIPYLELDDARERGDHD